MLSTTNRTASCLTKLILLFVALIWLSGCNNEPNKGNENKSETDVKNSPSQQVDSKAATPESTKAKKPEKKEPEPFAVPAADTSKHPSVIKDDIRNAYELALNDTANIYAVGQLGKYYHAYGYYNEAIKCYRRCIELASSETAKAQYYYCIGLAHQQSGSGSEALQAFEKSRELNDNYNPALVAVAETLIDRDLDRAVNYCTTALENESRNPHAHFVMAKCYRAKGNTELAIESLKRAVDSDPHYDAASLMLAGLLEKLGKSEEAKEHRNRAAEAIPPNWFSDPLRAELQALLRTPRKALEKSMEELRAKRPEAALKMIEEALVLEPDHVDALVARGFILNGLTRFSEAVVPLEQALKQDDSRIDTMGLLATAYLQIERFTDAESLFKKIHEARPDDIKTLELLAASMHGQGKPEAFVAYLEDRILKEPDNPNLRFLYAVRLIQRNEWEAAILQLEKGLELQPRSDSATFRLALAYRYVGRIDDAIEAAYQVLRINPDHDDSYAALAQWHQDRGEHKKGLQILESGMKSLPNSHVIHNALAWLLATSAVDELRDGARALELSRKTCDHPTYGQNPTYHDTLAAAYAELGQFEEALKVQEKAIQMAEAINNETLLVEFNERLDLYREGKPYRDVRKQDSDKPATPSTGQ